MTSMDCSSPSTETPTKVNKTAPTYVDSRAMAKSHPFSPTPNIVQRIKYVMALDHSEQTTQPKKLSYRQVADNLTVFDFDGVEFLAVNAPLNEVANWTPQSIPYQCFWVKTSRERNSAIIGTGTLLAALHSLTPCAIGIKIDPETCASTESTYHNLTELRRSIWNFILSEISFIPPHIKTFLEAELSIEAQQFKQTDTIKIKPAKKRRPTGITNDKVTFLITQ